MTPIKNVKARTAEATMQPTAAISAMGGATPNRRAAGTPIKRNNWSYDRQISHSGMPQGKLTETVQRRRPLTLAEYARTKRVRPQLEELAAQRNILDRFEEAIGRRFVVGERRTAKVLYLALTSRFLAHPVSVTIKGPSSGGKSYLTQQVLRFFPPSAYCILTATSEKALAYWEEPLEHRFIVLFEATAVQGDSASYLIRTLLSEGCIRYVTVESTDDGLRPRLIERQGPTGLITTTTSISLYPENETRWFCVEVDDTPEQTRNVLKAIATSVNQGADGNGDDETGTFIELQEWLEVANHEVVIPYAEALAEKMPPVAPRLRRDFERVINLIKAHAIIHQATRQLDHAGRIVATLEDYAAVRDLVNPILSQAVQMTVSATMRETVEAVGRANKRGGISVRRLAEILNLDISSTSRRVDACLERGYLLNLETRRGLAYKLVLGDPLPGGDPLLPEPESLEGLVALQADPGGIGSPPPCSELPGSANLDAARHYAAASQRSNQEAT